MRIALLRIQGPIAEGLTYAVVSLLWKCGADERPRPQRRHSFPSIDRETMSKRQENKDRATNMLAEGITALQGNEGIEAYLTFRATFRQYSFANTMLIMVQRPSAQYVMGYKSWQKHGRQVRKGEKGLLIWVPYFGQATAEDAEKNKGVAVGDRILKGFGTGYVFDILQTEIMEEFDGEPMTMEDVRAFRSIGGESHADMLRDLIEVAGSWGYTVKDLPASAMGGIVNQPGACGMVDFKNREICLNDTLPTNHRVKTLVHELAHAELHADLEREDRDKRAWEVEAESSAFIVCKMMGLDTSSYSFSYVAGWAGEREGDELQAFLESRMGRIDAGVDSILEAIEGVRTARAERVKREVEGFERETFGTPALKTAT